MLNTLKPNETDEEEQDNMIQVRIVPMETERRTSWKYKDVDPCFKFQRRTGSGEDGVDRSDRGEEEKDAEYEDYDILPYRWRMTREVD